ncbi:MAG: ABC transporter ATP-binding protein [Chloroflexi bacterium]|nr:ABC transporter ATP-binding protein [Chloroflexota bacterium]
MTRQDLATPAIRCIGLTKRFGDVTAVDRVDLAVEQGKKLVLLGPSGCGKTTLLRLIAGFESPTAGTLAVGGHVVAWPQYSLPPEKRRVGMVFQDYALFPHLDVRGNVWYGISRWSDREERVQEVLRLVGLEGKERRMPHELSGGEQQRVALARALAPKPAVVLLDEPFSNLDTRLRSRVRAEVKAILGEAKATSIFVTHDQEEALFMGDTIAVMAGGRIEQVDTPESIFHRPATPFVARFMGVADFVPGRVEGDVLVTELGLAPRPLTAAPGAAVEVMVRPDDLSIHPDGASGATVVERIFLGGHYTYTVRLPSGAEVHCLMEHYQTYEVGERVAVRLDPGHPLTCFENGRLHAKTLA